MKYFEITDWFNQPGRWFLGSPRNRSGLELDPRMFTEGRKYCGETCYPNVIKKEHDISQEIPFEVPVKRGTKPLDFTFGSFNMPVVTEAIGKCIHAHCVDDTQLIPVKVDGIEGGFYILNAIRVLDAVDAEQSEISWRIKEDKQGNKVQSFAGIGRLVLIGKVVECASIFRLRGWELPLIVDETVKGLLENQRTSGIRFQELRTT